MRRIWSGIYFGLLVVVSGADWPDWRGADYDGISKETDWDAAEIGNIVWKAEVGVGFSSLCDETIAKLR